MLYEVRLYFPYLENNLSIVIVLLIDRKFLLAIIIMHCYFRQECENAGGTESGSCADGTH